ncbi:hypothetical protein NVS55_12200 [Myxococcus stipitatus]|uniref:hypothetical protein n=1 Tax=Myxococcus stipitatus TaxID=83455 RepID=UPI003145497E
MKANPSFAFVVLCAALGLSGCGSGSDVPLEEGTDTTAMSAEGVGELVPVALESGEVTALACTHNSTRYARNGCCTQTATKFQQQICIYGTWYWQTPYRCEYPTSYCLP